MGKQARARLGLILGLLLGAIACVFFVVKTARELVLFGDSAELVAAAKLWGVPHPPGYPVWTLCGHLASLLPTGSVAFRVNLTSALYHALCVGLIAALASRLAGPIAAIAAAGALALSRSFLLASTYAEVFPLNDALFALCLLMAFSLGANTTPRLKHFVAFAACLGLALGHHQMTVLGLPALFVLAFPAMAKNRASWLIVPLSAAAVYALSVGLLVIAARRETLVSYGAIHDFGSLFRVLTRADYGGLWSASRHPSSAPLAQRLGGFALVTYQSMGPVVLGLSAIGALSLVGSQKRVLTALALGFGVCGPLFAVFNRVSVADEAALAFFERFTTMAALPLAVGCGIGAAWLADRIPPALPGRRAGLWAIAALPLIALVPTASAVDPRRDRAGIALARDLLRDVPDGSLVLISGDLYTNATLYLCAVENACEHVVVAAPGQLFLPWKRAELARRHPELELPEGRIVLARSHEIVARALPHRAVFVMPSLLLRDPELARGFEFVPSRLLLRVLRTRDEVEAERNRFLAFGHALAAAKDCDGCALDPRDVTRPSMHVEVLEAYANMYRNHARQAARFGAPELDKELDRRARSLEAVVVSR